MIHIPKRNIAEQQIVWYSGRYGLEFAYDMWYDFRLYVEKMDGHITQIENWDCLNIDGYSFDIVLAMVNAKIPSINAHYGTDFKPFEPLKKQKDD